MVFTVEDTPTPRVLLARYDPGEHEEFAEMLAELPPLRDESRRAAVLTNRSLQSITAMVCRWVVVDESATTKTTYVVRDDYFPPPPDRALLPSAGLLVTILGFHEPLDTRKPYYWLSAGNPLASDISDATAVTVSLDSAVFEDGRIIGPDTHRIGDYVHNRYTAALWLAQRVDEGEAAGRSAASVLKSIAEDSAEPDRWRRRLARQRQHDPSSVSAWLHELPKPPKFFRSR
jgi:hypothetical protein